MDSRRVPNRALLWLAVVGDDPVVKRGLRAFRDERIVSLVLTRLKARWQLEYAAWPWRRLDNLEG
jgi:hypothetical protein